MTSMALDSEDRQALRDAFGAFFTKESPPERVRAAEPLGFDADLWTKVCGLGVPEMGLGGQASLADLAVVAAEYGAHLAPVPLVEAVVATRLLERLGACDPELASGDVVVTVAVRPSERGVARLVPAGAVAGLLVALDGDELVVAREQVAGSSAAPDNLGRAPFADRALGAERVVLVRGDAARALHADALDEWRVLTAAALTGAARRALDLAVGYAKTREQFGVPIGSFQAIQHLLADVATAVDGAELLVRRAASADDRRAVLAAMAFRFASEAAREAAATAVHVHGGYGFMEEYDVQLFFRRVSAWALALGDPAVELARLADLLAAEGWTGAEATPAGFRAEVRAFLAEHCTAEMIDRAHRTGTVHDWGLHRALAERGWLAAEWPPDWGGQGYDPFEIAVLHEELARAGAPVDGWGTSNLVAHTLAIAGTEQQKTEVVPRILQGDVLCCLGYSEPDCGSDVAAASTRAVRDGGEWVINGQKMFTTLAHEATYVFLLTRTNLDVAKHRGLTMFLVPMDTPGIEIAPIATLGGERTNITFYTDVRVPDSCRVGDVDGGWDVMNVALAFERRPIAHGETERLYRLVAGAAATDVPAVRERLARVAIDLEVGRALGQRLTERMARGELAHVEGSMAKLFASEAFVRAARDLLDVLGTEGLLAHGVPAAPADGWAEHAYRHAQVMTIYAGTSEIQRTIIAERGLGLPRSPRS